MKSISAFLKSLSWQKVFILLAILVCLFAMFVAAKRGVAAIYAEDASDLVEGWNTENFTADSWHQAMGLMETALWLDGSNPSFNHRVAIMQHMGMSAIAENDSERQQMAELAVSHFLASLQIRPRWPLTWASLALLKRDLGQVDEQMLEAIEKAVTYGPWEPEVHQLITEVGLSSWARLKDAQRQMVSDNVMRGLISPVPRSAGKVLDVLEKHLASIDQDISAILLATLAKGVLQKQWQGDRILVFVEMVLLVRDRFAPEVRAQLDATLIGHIQNPTYTNRLLSLARAHGKLPVLCTMLPRTLEFGRFCRNSNM